MLFSIVKIVVTDPSGLHTWVCDINREDLREQLAEVEASDLDDGEKSRKRGKCHTRLASWSPRGRSAIGIAVLDDEGSPTSDKGASEALKSHWESLFLIMLLGIVVLSIVFPGLCRSALRGLSP